MGVHRRDPRVKPEGGLWTKTNMTRLRGWAPKGERLIDKVPQGRWKTATFLAALRQDRIDAPCLFDGPINGERFRAYVEQFLVPTLKPGDVVILDNLVSHKGKAARRAIRDVGARLVFLPIDSPTSTQSSRSSPSSKPCCEKSEREATRRSQTPAVKSSPRTPARRMRPIHQQRRIRVNLKAGCSSRLLKKSLRFRNSECRRDCLRPDGARVRGSGPASGHCSLALHVAGRTSPLGAISLGRRTML